MTDKEELNKLIPKTYRLLNTDGTFNVVRKKKASIYAKDIYHSLLSTSWPVFLALLLGTYLLINILFGSLYYLAGPKALEGLTATTNGERFLECFFFSVQTVATIGYGKLTPRGITANLLVTIEALIGMFSIALQTGLVFSRFSKPTSKVVFSDVALINNQDGVRSLICRIANARMNQIVEAKAHLILLIDEMTKEGERFRNFYELKLEQNVSPVFALSWTLVHPIEDSSPLKNMTIEKLAAARAEIFLTVTGIDETFAQSVHSRHSYIPKEIIEGYRFADMIFRTEDGLLSLDIDKIHTLIKI